MHPFFKLILLHQSNCFRSPLQRSDLHLFGPSYISSKLVAVVRRIYSRLLFWQPNVTFPLLPVSCWQKHQRVKWTREGRRGFWLFVPSVSWPQLWLIKERIAIPAPRHPMSHRPCCIFCQGLVPAHLDQRTEKGEYYSFISPVYTQCFLLHVTQPIVFSDSHLEVKPSEGRFVGSGVMAVIPSGNRYSWHVVHLTSHFYKGHPQKEIP